ncbi:hypothetical protein GCM10010218_08930 [Streptomyces mashuensis]|uniref:DinB family protein n=1 Tax=Streptomyces mashuensis TaxID=33904 RepID=A0A919E8Z4_9ACTN|nr:hypothetical protein [Streptomyces mashuensis]GHF29941.1 hypothetical protein GCM10010218_08930 [Streptomyces mashuensis]
MDTSELDRAYQELLTAAESLGAAPALSEAGRTAADWLLVHVALTDDMLARAAGALLADRAACVDNAAAMSRVVIAQTVAATTYAERLALVRQSAERLLGLLGELPAASAGAGVRVRLVDRAGREVFDDELCWADVLLTRARDHLPGHVRTLRAVAAGHG